MRTARTVDHNLQRNIQYHVTSCSAAGVWERKIKQNNECWCLSSSVFIPSPLQMMEPCFSGNGWILPAHGKWPMNSLFCFDCMCRFNFTCCTYFVATYELSPSCPSKWQHGACWLPELNHSHGPIQLQIKRKICTSGVYKCVWQSYLHYSSSDSWFL